ASLDVQLGFAEPLLEFWAEHYGFGRQAGDVESLGKFAARQFLAFLVARPMGDQANQAFGRYSRGAIGRKARIAVTLGEPTSIAADDQRNMPVGWGWAQIEPIVKQLLPWDAREQIGTANDSVDSLPRIVDHDGKLIAGGAPLG